MGSAAWKLCTVLFHTMAFGLMLAAVIGNSWAVISMKNGAHILHNNRVITLNGDIVGSYGLWEYCTRNTTSCIRMNYFYGEKDGNWFKACQMSAITACTFAMTAFFAALLNPCFSDCAGVIASLNMFLAWICMTSAVSIFTAKESTNSDNAMMEKRVWGWTYIVAWSGSAISLIASITAWLSYTPKHEESEVNALFVLD